MIPSSQQVADNIKKHVDAMAQEVGRRYYEGGGDGSQVAFVKKCAQDVLLDWLLGDWMPPTTTTTASAPAAPSPPGSLSAA